MNRRVLGPLVVAVVAVLAAALVFWWTVSRPDQTASTARTRTTALPIERVVSRAGAFSVGVPKGLRGHLEHGAAYLSSRDRTVVVLVSRSEPGALRAVNRRLVQQMREGYRTVRVQGSRPERLHGRAGLSTYGSAVNRRGVRFRFVQTTLRARPRNLTVATFTARGTDPRWVLPRVNAVLDSVRVLPRS